MAYLLFFGLGFSLCGAVHHLFEIDGDMSQTFFWFGFLVFVSVGIMVLFS